MTNLKEKNLSIRRVRDLKVGDRLVVGALCESDEDKAQAWLDANRTECMEFDRDPWGRVQHIQPRPRWRTDVRVRGATMALRPEWFVIVGSAGP